MLEELILLRPDYRWILFSHRPLHKEHAALLRNRQIALQITEGRLPGPIWLHFVLPRLVRLARCDLFWATLAMLPYRFKKRGNTRAIVNFHDLNAFVAAETMVRWNRWQHRLLDGPTIAEADAVLCLSRTTQNDLIRFFPTCEQKLHVVYPGAEPLPKKSEKPAGLARTGAYLLSVGTIEPRKNYATLIAGYLLAKQKIAMPPLVIVGKKGWGPDELYKRLQSGELRDKGILYLEHVNDAELAYCYRHAAFVVSASLHEGFGLPVLEGFFAGKQCLLSDIPIFREIGKKQTFVSPRDPVQWGDALAEMVARYRARKLPPPPLDTRFWSWKRRVRSLLKIVDLYS